jgi:hypothetical protein
VLGALVVLLVVNFDALLGSASSPLRWILPGLALGGAVLGLTWGRLLRTRQPDVYAGIGRSAAVAQDADDEDLVLPKLRK